ncbi:nuclease-related domain-containing protein [Streptomyces albus]|uniref:nuclease-related domain-containing protein n=1 Tax=Streptomyces albus TaxID=1888 RepID=UPI0033EED118
MKRRTSAGASARRQYHLRRRAWRRRALRRWLYGLPLALPAAAVLAWWTGWHTLHTPAFGAAAGAAALGAFTLGTLRTPQHVTAWRQGAQGERSVARVLERTARRRGGVVLADRLEPGSRSANIDFFFTTAAGSWVVDAKNWQARGARVELGPDGTLWYGNRPQHKTLRGVKRQARQAASAISRVLGEHVEVTPILAICGAPVGRRGVLAVDGVLIVELRRLPSVLRSRLGNKLTVAETDRVAEAARRVLLPA